jgi:S1-C subfamily serine protease
MRIKYLVLSVFAFVLLAGCNVEISTSSGEDQVVAQEPKETPAEPEPTPEPTEPVNEDDEPADWDTVRDQLSSSVVKIGATYHESELTDAASFAGSGMVISDSGHILTVASLVTGADEVLVWVEGEDGDIEEARLAQVLGSSGCDDLSVIQIADTSGLTPVTTSDAADLEAGSEVAAIGFPVAEQGLDYMALTIDQGVVQHVDQETPPLPSTIWHDGGMTDGLEGGVLVDQNGVVFGMNVYVDVSEQTTSTIGLAIPMSYVDTLADTLMDGRDVRSLGVSLMPNDYPEIYGVSHGVLVSHVAQGTPAAAIGLRAGDLITEYDDESVQDYAHLCSLARQFDEGDAVDIGVVAIEDGWLQYLFGTFVYGDPEAGIALEVVWSEEHEAAFDDSGRESELDTPGGEVQTPMEFALSRLDPPQWELAGPMTYGIGYGTAEVQMLHWGFCDGEWSQLGHETISLEADIWVDEPRIGEANPIYLTLQSYEYDVDGSFVIVSSSADDFTGEYTTLWDIEVDGIYFAGELVSDDFDPIEAGGYIWSWQAEDGCDIDTSEWNLRSLAMDEGSMVVGYIGPETAHIIIYGTSWDGTRDFMIEIEAEMFSWDEFQ